MACLCYRCWLFLLVCAHVDDVQNSITRARSKIDLLDLDTAKAIKAKKARSDGFLRSDHQILKLLKQEVAVKIVMRIWNYEGIGSKRAMHVG